MVEIQKKEQALLSTASDDPMVGSVLGEKFRIIGKVGSGGLSDVYKACDLQSARTVAVKILRITRETTKQGFELFTSNARLTVQHPHLITPIALGLTAEGEPWLAMEWLDAKPLSAWLAEEGALSMTTIVEMFKQVADFLSYAHSQGEVHMNLKPSNILLVEGPQGAFVKIADFGYAKMLMERELEMADEKAPARGSPLYMSPEQFKGTRIDSRSDIYSVACMMYECFYGRPPHQGVDLLETMDRHMHAEVTFPSEPELPEAAQEVLRIMLLKDSTERPRSIQEAMQLLESGLEGHFPKPEPRPEPAFTDARGVDFITAKRGTAARKGREPWMLLMGCVTVLLFVLIFQQCMVMIRDTTHGKHHGNQVKKVNPAN